jgi:hypothetical protein
VMKPKHSSSSRSPILSLLVVALACARAPTGSIDLFPSQASGGATAEIAGAGGNVSLGGAALDASTGGSAGHDNPATCSANAQCSALAPHCASGSCVACTVASDCPDSLGHCVAAQCVPCEADADCGGRVCRSGRCGDPCSVPSDCHRGKVAACTASGLCVECTGDADCTDGSRLHCSAVGACVACLTKADCADSQQLACALDGQCAECGFDGDCASGKCDTGQGHCL